MVWTEPWTIEPLPLGIVSAIADCANRCCEALAIRGGKYADLEDYGVVGVEGLEVGGHVANGGDPAGLVYCPTRLTRLLRDA